MAIIFQIVFSALLVFLQNVNGFLNDYPTVNTKLGQIRGLRAKDGDYNMFMGIPYAIVNSSNVFGESLPHPPFEEVFEANNDSAICPQIEEFHHQPVGSLDCLHLNIYVPNSNPPKEGFPVLFYIYGGSFKVGFAGRFMYGPKYLVRHNIIFVTFNYRLGPYGFMCLHNPDVPGNAGMKDQDDALRWIKDNVKSFGGDSNRISLCGNSAGAMAVGLHLVSESEKIFHNVIMQSGSVFHPNLIKKEDINAPFKIAAELGFETNDIHKVLVFLSNVDTHVLVKAASVVKGDFGVCIENKLPGTRIFLADHPININPLKARRINILQGYNNNEWMMGFVNIGQESEIAADLLFYSQLNKTFDFNQEIIEAEAIVRHFYIGDNDINHEVKWELADFLSDFWTAYPAIKNIRRYFDSGANKVYQYLFSYDGKRNFIKLRDSITGPGANHADEIGYLFDMQGLDYIPKHIAPIDQIIIDRMTTMWANFVKYDDPTPDMNTLLPVRWKPITKNSPHHFLNINNSMSIDKAYSHQRMAFWNLFYKKYAKFERGYKNINSKKILKTFTHSTNYQPHFYYVFLNDKQCLKIRYK